MFSMIASAALDWLMFKVVKEQNNFAHVKISFKKR
jgi:hypothetical protein